ncbi:MAG: hypothetical protein COA73_06695 [Candidatus Hydrogenedentota bacterium]|nr:MAG: hypothetical protein COA73_06695 [Candidatus Hydrogenedentota bacterium]
MNIQLFGSEAEKLLPMIEQYADLTLVEEDPEVVVCFGGDGTLLEAEMQWPNVPKVPIRNSRRGIRCIPNPPEEVLARLAVNELVRREHLKLKCSVSHAEKGRSDTVLMAINEFSVHMGRSNSSVRFKMWLDGQQYGEASDKEFIGDGFIVSTPFGSTAYFNKITRCIFWSGIGIAFMYANQHTNHLIVSETSCIEAEITRGPAILAHDNSSTYIDLQEGDRLSIVRSEKPAVLLMME